MELISLSANDGFDRLQRVLLAMQIGDDLCVNDAAQVSGLKEHVCLAVLEGLTRAGLMIDEGDARFTRCALDVLGS